MEEERFVAAAKNSRRKRESKRTSDTPQSRGSADLGKVVTGSATQSLWLKDREVGSQVIGEDRSRLPVRRTVGEVRRGGKRASDRTKERVYGFRVRFVRERRASRLPCLSLGLVDD